MNGYMTVNQVAARAGVSAGTVRRNSAAGLIPAPLKLTPSKHYWKESEVLAWLENGMDYVKKGKGCGNGAGGC